GIGGVPEAVLKAMEAEVTKQARPDLTLILDGPVDQLLARRQQRGTSDVFERRPVEFHESVRKSFLDIANADEDRCVVLNALGSPDDLVSDAMIAIKYRLLDL
ncbi:MAG: thymidylate kinase, partial [Henriciella sp.]|uniref:dTMP kinase n=1 Tax=Henriciella sp. TaxID=1968823 RepID=UPI003C750CD3